MKTKRYTIIRTVVNSRGSLTACGNSLTACGNLNAEIELSAPNATAARTAAARLFAHERGTVAAYRVKPAAPTYTRRKGGR